MKILLIEDDDAVRNTLLTVLEEKDFIIEESTSAEEALAKLPGDYDLVISDVLLKNMDGISFLERVNQMESRIPVLMITGLGSHEVEAACRKKGAAGFLYKPFSIRTLLRAIEDIGKTSC